MKATRFLFFGCLMFSAVLLCNISFAEENPSQYFEEARHSFILSTKDIIEDHDGKTKDYPKYTTQLINLANQNSQATRSKNVGQMSELIQQFPGKSYDEWEQWYLKNYPESIDQATDKTFKMIQKMQQAMANIDKDLVRQWIKELILSKTYAGLCFQESILRKISEKEKTSYRLATPDEESKGIDGYIGINAVSIKPISYKAKSYLPEDIKVEIIYYEKINGGIKVFYK